MKLLLDTHTWLWFVLGESSLSSTARALVEDTSNEKFLSPASYWETAIKISIGKYRLPQPWNQFISQAIEGAGFVILPILPKHAEVLSSLPFHHRDPFDRLIIAQATSESMPIISRDAELDADSVQRLW